MVDEYRGRATSLFCFYLVNVFATARHVLRMTVCPENLPVNKYQCNHVIAALYTTIQNREFFKFVVDCIS